MRRSYVGMGAVAVMAAALVACRNGGADGAIEDTTYRSRPGYVIDSVRPIEVELARFRQPLGPAPTELTGGAASLEALLRNFATAVEARDTTALLRMQIDAPEFAWLIYPSSPYTKPPYQQSPQYVWSDLRHGDVGLTRLLQRRGGQPLRVVGHRCDPEPVVEGENQLWRHCVVQTNDAGTIVTERLFGVVIQRHGHFKFASYQNQY